MADSFRVRLTGPGTLAGLREALCGGRAIGCGDDAIDQVADVLQFTREPLIGPGWAGRADVTIVLRDDVTPAGLSALRERAAGVEGVTSVTYVPATPGRPGPPRASIPGSPYPDLGTPASLKVAIAETADAARFLPALCRTELTGDCADGVAMVIEHPRVVDTATPGP